jgi:HEAT repeats
MRESGSEQQRREPLRAYRIKEPAGPAAPPFHGRTRRHAARSASVDYAWRRHGEPMFALVALGVFLVEGAALGLLTWSLLFRSSASEGTFLLRNTLVAAVSLTAICLAVVTAVVLGFSAASARREERFGQRVSDWRRRWHEVVEGHARCPEGPLSQEAVTALLEVRESASAANAPIAEAAVRASGADQILLRRLAVVTSRRAHRRPGVLGWSCNLGTDLDLLDDLARARLPEAVPGLLDLVSEHEPPVRTMALRAAARSIAAIGPGEHRSNASLALLERLRNGGLPRTALDEGLLLLEEAATPVVSAILSDHAADVRLVASALDSAGRLRLVESADLVAARLEVTRPREERAAALRALAAMSVLPVGATSQVRCALSADDEAVRTQAARAAVLLDPSEAVPTLLELLGDRSWWVRRAAGESLSNIAGPGREALLEATSSHHDRFARDMACQLVRERGLGPVGESEVLAASGARGV